MQLQLSGAPHQVRGVSMKRNGRGYWATDNPQHSEELYVSPIKCNLNVSIKGGVLLEAAKIFDPLSLYLLLTIRSRVLIRSRWKNDSGWEEPLQPAILSDWKELAEDLSGLSDRRFCRRAYCGRAVWRYVPFFATLPMRHMSLLRISCRMVGFPCLRRLRLCL